MAVIVVVIPVVMIPVIPVPIVVPAMIVFDSSVVSIPVTREEFMAVVARFNPAGAFIGRARPIAVMPSVMPSVGKPIAANPGIPWAWLRRLNPDHARARRRADSDSYRNLCAKSRNTRQQHRGKQCCPDENLHCPLTFAASTVETSSVGRLLAKGVRKTVRLGTLSGHPGEPPSAQ